MRVIGKIQFERVDKSFAIRQGWNPSELTREERKQIADELVDIANQMRQDRFEDKGEYKYFAVKTEQVTQ